MVFYHNLFFGIRIGFFLAVIILTPCGGVLQHAVCGVFEKRGFVILIVFGLEIKPFRHLRHQCLPSGRVGQGRNPVQGFGKFVQNRLFLNQSAFGVGRPLIHPTDLLLDQAGKEIRTLFCFRTFQGIHLAVEQDIQCVRHGLQALAEVFAVHQPLQQHNGMQIHGFVKGSGCLGQQTLLLVAVHLP